MYPVPKLNPPLNITLFFQSLIYLNTYVPACTSRYITKKSYKENSTFNQHVKVQSNIVTLTITDEMHRLLSKELEPYVFLLQFIPLQKQQKLQKKIILFYNKNTTLCVGIKSDYSLNTCIKEFYSTQGQGTGCYARIWYFPLRTKRCDLDASV